MRMKVKKVIKIIVFSLCAIFIILKIVAKKAKRDSIYDNLPEEKNPMEGKKVVFVECESDMENADGVKGHLEAVENSDYHPRFYARYVKRAIDVIISFAGLIILSPLFMVIAIAIKIEDPGPVFFTQKRLGQNKRYFKLHKFRSMKMSTPHDVPTHMLDQPEQYITKVGKFIRVHSLDELPQIWDIFVGNLSTIGPRPSLWNQDLLIAERDKYGANDVKPGLTGWAQINGRDELEIPEKAALDGEYVKRQSFLFDLRCFLGTMGKVAKDDSVVEGRSGECANVSRNYTKGANEKELIGHVGLGEAVEVDTKIKKKVLITGARSYIGDCFQAYVSEHYSENFSIDVLDMMDSGWKDNDFSKYDSVYHVAGIAHADIGKVSKEEKEKYYKVNQDYVFATDETIGNLPNLLVVADGMGGHRAGDFASRFTVEVLAEEVQNCKETHPETILGNSIQAANERLLEEAEKDNRLEGMGTTLVAATILDHVLYFANVGDSRLYLINKEIRQLSKDHSMVEEMVRLGGLTEEEAKHHPDKNIITRAIGVKQKVEPDFFEYRLKGGDIILMCSDGLTNMVDDDEIFQIVKSARDIVEAVESLIQRANENGGSDNIGVVLAQPYADEVSVW